MVVLPPPPPKSPAACLGAMLTPLSPPQTTSVFRGGGFGVWGGFVLSHRTPQGFGVQLLMALNPPPPSPPSRASQWGGGGALSLGGGSEPPQHPDPPLTIPWGCHPPPTPPPPFSAFNRSSYAPNRWGAAAATTNSRDSRGAYSRPAPTPSGYSPARPPGPYKAGGTTPPASSNTPSSYNQGQQVPPPLTPNPPIPHPRVARSGALTRCRRHPHSPTTVSPTGRGGTTRATPPPTATAATAATAKATPSPPRPRGRATTRATTNTRR